MLPKTKKNKQTNKDKKNATKSNYCFRTNNYLDGSHNGRGMAEMEQKIWFFDQHINADETIELNTWANNRTIDKRCTIFAKGKIRRFSFQLWFQTQCEHWIFHQVFFHDCVQFFQYLVSHFICRKYSFVFRWTLPINLNWNLSMLQIKKKKC